MLRDIKRSRATFSNETMRMITLIILPSMIRAALIIQITLMLFVMNMGIMIK